MGRTAASDEKSTIRPRRRAHIPPNTYQVERPTEVHVEQTLPQVLGKLGKRGRAGYADARDKAGWRPELVLQRLGGGGDGSRRGYVALGECHGGILRRDQVEHAYPGPERPQLARCGQADAAGSARYPRDLVLQDRRRHNVSLRR
jgi:hypothetical protein